MPAWSTTRLTAREVNTLVTIVSLVVSFCVSFMLDAVALEIRRLVIVRGGKDAILQDAGCRSVWTALKKSKARSWTVLAILPVLLNYAAHGFTEFTTSGISASVVYTEGDKVSVLGLVGSEIAEYQPVFPSINKIIDDSKKSGIDSGYLALLSPELTTVGFSSDVAGYQVVPQNYTGSNNELGVFIPGKSFDAPLTVTLSFCLEVSSENGVLTVDKCRERLIVETSQKKFEVLTNATKEYAWSQECSGNTTIALGNQGLGVVQRDLTFYNGSTVAATCASIFESVIESCVWTDSGKLYFGDWNVQDAGNCGNMATYWPMFTVGIEYDAEMAQGSDAAMLLASMTAETFSGTGTLSSRQQLVEILGAVVRLESIEWGVQSAYVAKEVVEIGISLWIPLVLFISLFLPGVAWVFFRFRSGKKEFFLPVGPAEWSACAARELHGDKASWWTVSPVEDYYDHVYAFGPVSTDARGVASQRLEWIRKQDVLPVVESADRFSSAWDATLEARVERIPPVSASDPRLFEGGASSAAISTDGRR